MPSHQSELGGCRSAEHLAHQENTIETSDSAECRSLPLFRGRSRYSFGHPGDPRFDGAEFRLA